MRLQTVFWVLYAAWVVTELWVVTVTRTKRGGNEERGGSVQDKGSLRVLWLTIFGSITVGEFLGPNVAATRMHVSPWLVVGLMAVGLAVRWSAIHTLGKAFSANVAIHATQRLNTSGLFRYARHPSYTGLLVILVAMGLSTRNWLSLVIMVVGPFLALSYRIKVEEVALTGAFGEEYVEYSRRTKRLVPFVY
jgi:protein-S-isoprenylcysteine O-methyltransferase Ste14